MSSSIAAFTFFQPVLLAQLKASTTFVSQTRKRDATEAATRRSFPLCSAPPKEEARKCVRCGKSFKQSENSAKSCLYHGDILGNVITLNLYEDHHFDDASLDNVKGPRYGKRWGCCLETEVDAPPCKSGFHVTYDCDPQRWAAGIDFAKR